ncbi:MULTISPECIES: ABC transporter substrate-binding protein [unclassified Variovorax]|jgi:NitT/TauT family transport system substrate-binding protein/sulfonate transport system substrate-binding protein|uniref:ABC transporter substrate-binding protein n=1 Tax=unclassified Variovorax TaxID=663243 RepID=UPI000D12D09D|nr:MULTISPECIES: ABC transporter substrate-binding protein [unclassified Variovorax]AVQ80442.1 aliphatic sulfonate ABC transporter substrate-binding protein [Variovorax sp. PMC12]QRY30149.1 ABC transporter substrate-binding protein [Variovorax sp. PDNC026]
MTDQSGRRRLLRGAIAAAGASALPLFSIAQGSGQVLRLGYIGPGKKPANATGWALRQGHLQRELAALGFTDVTTRNFPNGPDLNEAFIAGALDVGIYGDTPAIVARSRGLESQLIGFDAVGMNVWLLTPRNGVRSVKELDGKSIGVARGSYMHRYVLGLLKEHGLQKSVKVIHMFPRDGEAALDQGSIAAFAAQIDVGPLLASRGYPVIDEAEQHPTLRGTSVIVASSKLLAAAPGVPAAWTRARRTALQEIRRDSAAYYAFHAEVSGFPLDVVRVSHPLSQFPEAAYPAEGLALLDEVKKFLLAENLVSRDFALAQWRAPEA